ncbi:MAG: hypothetical protein QOJ35_2968 [Solirubrobacteraceae bacterium]|jgi:hypothetical protein|nr:hypothetical protein [Solirubrobacteraceae bacterium]
MADGCRVVVLGALAEMPFAGVAWQVLHYLEGFRRLGHEVSYVEDTGKWPYDPYLQSVTAEAGGAVRRLRGLLDRHGFAGRWAFRNAAAAGELHGMSAEQLARTLRTADVLVNLSGVCVLGEQHLQVPIRIYLETDPVTPQIEVAEGRRFTIDLLAAHTHHFTFGERIGTPGCAVPVGRFDYRPTRQPVVLDWWSGHDGAVADGPLRCTTIASWQQSFKDVTWQGETYTWSKSVEFEKLLGVPARVGATLELALAIGDDDALARLRRAGFVVRRAQPLSDDPGAYRTYIQRSGAEFTAAKDQHVRLRSGWFSDRTATYLAAGRPAVVQDTGFDAVLPTGEGLLAFRTADEAVAALEDVAGAPERHARAAREVAEAFAAETVLARLLRDAGV